jgi:hypothetical protein
LDLAHYIELYYFQSSLAFLVPNHLRLASAEEPKTSLLESEAEMPKHEKLDNTAHAESFGLDALEQAEDEEEHDA